MNNLFLLKFKVIALYYGFFFHLFVFAPNNGNVCSHVGYTVFTINGVFTNKN